MVPVGSVSCAAATFKLGAFVSLTGPAEFGSIQKTAPSVTSSPLCPVHVSKGMPIVLIAPGLLASVIPHVSHESSSAYPSASLFAMG
jgi:hypothetical protein